MGGMERRKKGELEPGLSIVPALQAKSQAGQQRPAAQECSSNLKLLLSPSTPRWVQSAACVRLPLTCPLNRALSSLSPFLTLCVSGYEEVVRIPKGSVFIHIQELNISLNYLGKTGLILAFSCFSNKVVFLFLWGLPQGGLWWPFHRQRKKNLKPVCFLTLFIFELHEYFLKITFFHFFSKCCPHTVRGRHIPCQEVAI